MSNNELYEHKRSDTVKWVLTLFAFILVGVMLAGIILGWFDKKEEPPAEEEQTEQAAIVDGDGNAMDEDIVYPINNGSTLYEDTIIIDLERRVYAISEMQDLFGQKSLCCHPAYGAPV